MTTDYGKRLRAARKHAEMTQVELSKLTGIPQSTISTAERLGNGSAETPIYAKACGVDAHWLATGEGEMLPSVSAQFLRISGPAADRVEAMASMGAVPLISWVQAGCWSDVADPFQPGDADEWLPCPVAHGPHTYAVKVRGDSMNNPGGRPSYADGDIIFVDPSREAKHGDRVIVHLDDQAEATFKQLLIEDGRKLLKALNPEWSPRYIQINGNATIKGVVIGKWVPE